MDPQGSHLGNTEICLYIWQACAFNHHGTGGVFLQLLIMEPLLR